MASEQQRDADFEHVLQRMWTLEEIAQRYVPADAALETARYAFLLMNMFTRESSLTYMRLHMTAPQLQFTLHVARIELARRYHESFELALATDDDWGGWIESL